MWYTHEFDWVQSTSAILQPMARNMTEAWGVNAKIYFDSWRRFRTTLKIENLFWTETYLSLLEPPDWPEDIFGAIDETLAKEGKELYENAIWKPDLQAEEVPAKELGVDAYERINPGPQRGYCARCHQPQWSKLKDSAIDMWGDQYKETWAKRKQTWSDYKKTPEGAALIKDFTDKMFVQLRMYDLKTLGTDPADAINFNARQTSFFQLTTGPLADYFSSEQVGVAEALGRITLEAKKQEYDDLKLTPRERAEWDGFRPSGPSAPSGVQPTSSDPAGFRAPLAYPARPMRGYWATAPFLHNGSVPNMYQLLSPIEERDSVFYVGSTEYDPKRMGYSTRKATGFFRFDTHVSGNSNKGHEFRDLKPGESPDGVIGPRLTERQRYAIIEYMKKVKDITYTPVKPVEPKREEYADDASYDAQKKNYEWEEKYFKYRQDENLRRWRILESMKFNPTTTRFEFKKRQAEEKY
jgi:hypothetical protein